MKAKCILSLMVAVVLCMACDEPEQKSYAYETGLTGVASNTSTSSLKGTYTVASNSSFFNGEPFAVSFSEGSSKKDEKTGTITVTHTVRITPLGTSGIVEAITYEGSLSYLEDSSEATLHFSDEDLNYNQTGTYSFSTGTFTLTKDSEIIFKTTNKITDYEIENHRKKFYGTARFLANADNDFSSDSYQFTDSSGNGFYFATDKLVCLSSVPTSSGSTLTGNYRYLVESNRILVYEQNALTYEDDPIATFNYFITYGGYTVAGSDTMYSYYLWANGNWYQQVTRP